MGVVQCWRHSIGALSAYNPCKYRWSNYPQKISGSKKVKVWLGDPRPQIWHRGPLTSRAQVKNPKAAPNTKKTVVISAAVTEKIAHEKKNLTNSCGKTGGGMAPNRTCGAWSARRTMAESFVDLSRPVRLLDDFEEIAIWLYRKNARSGYREFDAIYASPRGKNTNDGVE